MRTCRQQWSDFINNKKTISKKDIQQSVSLLLRHDFCGTVLGIDPSLRATGVAVVHASKEKIYTLLHSMTIKCPSKWTQAECIKHIFCSVRDTIYEFSPDMCAMEETIYVQNYQTAQIMGVARGAIYAAIVNANLKIYEYAPLRIKQAITGYGRASKEQVSKMVQMILNTQLHVGLDETDAAAVAMCAIFTGNK